MGKSMADGGVFPGETRQRTGDVLTQCGEAGGIFIGEKRQAPRWMPAALFPHRRRPAAVGLAADAWLMRYWPDRSNVRDPATERRRSCVRQFVNVHPSGKKRPSHGIALVAYLDTGDDPTPIPTATDGNFASVIKSES